MSRLDDFLNLPNVADEVQEIYVNKRLGTFKVKPMTIEKHREFQDRCRGKLTKDGINFDNGKFNLLIITNQVIDPDFSNAEFLNKTGFRTPTEFVNAKLLPGEVIEIAQKICKLSGFDEDINNDVEEAKNS